MMRYISIVLILLLFVSCCKTPVNEIKNINNWGKFELKYEEITDINYYDKVYNLFRAFIEKDTQTLTRIANPNNMADIYEDYSTLEFGKYVIRKRDIPNENYNYIFTYFQITVDIKSRGNR
ncbi:MAG: hypothetical protein FWF15_04995 [Oscillospiraceae bacterium]|nr:hypothetical protein [Oscillospiraceae bacterium]